MRVTTIHGPRDIRLEEHPAPTVRRPTGAVVRVVAGCICGSDLWPYRGEDPVREPRRIGHEAVGVVEEVGSEVTRVRPGDFVVVPFCHCDGTCDLCRKGMPAACRNLGITEGGQGEYVAVDQADGSLVTVPGEPTRDDLPSLLALSDVLPTGWHAAVSARVAEGDTVVVVGDGAVGLCGVLAARELGAERIVAMSRHEPRQALARKFGATEVVAARGDEAQEAVLELTDGVGADAVLECVGTDQSVRTALRAVRPGGNVGVVGVPHGVELPARALFGRNIGVAGGMAPVRTYLDHLLGLTLAGRLDAGPVFDLTLPLEQVVEGYRAMDERRAVKVLLEP
ncbi:zinc-binding dehydrogenase [Nocardioides caldifontis]|uniref:zinc-binding dehydrogenase n=1 Tax=Nocardioides caldifontis TaxID=2588938 RepID=UPI0011DF6E1A|nr:zinc-binding dehydrogenase [Nocardioides caldifontis]